jgi:hypothetical protein
MGGEEESTSEMWACAAVCSRNAMGTRLSMVWRGEVYTDLDDNIGQCYQSLHTLCGDVVLEIDAVKDTILFWSTQQRNWFAARRPWDGVGRPRVGTNALRVNTNHKIAGLLRGTSFLQPWASD